jgi:prepilin-type N-terminal cleavage/methylation domain-containing protein
MTRRDRLTLRGQAGFTLTELLIACAMIGVVMAGLFSLLTTGQQSYLVGSNQAETQQELRLALQRMTQEIRDAGFCPTCASGAPPFSAITNASATGFTIQNDWNGTGIIHTTGTTNYALVNPDGSVTTTARGEWIVYAFSGGSLTRREVGVDGAGVPIAGNMAALTFTYLDAAGAVLASPVAAGQEANIRTIVVNAVGQPQNQPAIFQAGRVSVAMTDTIRLRNRIP